jgi:RNA polymerase sigma-70 factor (ECF subfamily)
MTAPYPILIDGQVGQTSNLNITSLIDSEFPSHRKTKAVLKEYVEERLSVRDVSESHLINKAKERDSEALSELYHRYADAVFRYVYYRVGDREVAEDLVGDVFVRALEGLPSYQDTGSPFEAWLYRIAHARVVDYYRRQQVRFAALLDERLAGGEGADPYRLVAHRDEARRAWSALIHLTDDQQQVIALRFIAGYSVAEAARLMGKTKGAVRALQHRALASLRRLLEGES